MGKSILKAEFKKEIINQPLLEHVTQVAGNEHIGVTVVDDCAVGNYPMKKVGAMALFSQFCPIHSKRKVILQTKVLNHLLTSEMKTGSIVGPIIDYPMMTGDKVA